MCLCGMSGLTDLDARCRSCRAVGLSQRRGLGSHVQRNGTGMYGVEEGREEKEGDEVRVLAKTMPGTSSVNSVFFVAISLVFFPFPPGPNMLGYASQGGWPSSVCISPG